MLKQCQILDTKRSMKHLKFLWF